MKKALLLCALGTALLGSQVAKADTFSFTFTGTVPLNSLGITFSGTGYFDATQIGATDLYNVTNVYNGSVTDSLGDSSDIAGLLAVNDYQGNDNILIYPGTFGIYGVKYFDHNGVSFSLVDGIDINLNDTLLFENAVAGAGGFDITELDVVDVSPAPAPEPGGLALLGTSILGGAGLLRRRYRA